MKVHFTKVHGTGNDFIIIDDRQRQFPAGVPLIAHLCDRHYGIGADGLILFFDQPCFDFGMSYFNSDGRESSMCGNGGRSVAAYARRAGFIGTQATFSAMDGAHSAEILSGQGPEMMVRVRLRDTILGESTALGTLINTGSPHLVRLVPDVDALDVVREGRRIRFGKKHSEEGINVDFVEVVRDGLKVRTYERGVEDETLSCGTGVTAAALVAAAKFEPSKDFYRIHTRGGELLVMYKRKKQQFTDVWLEGPVRFVFDGVMEI